jgi:hypothetical protein
MIGARFPRPSKKLEEPKQKRDGCFWTFSPLCKGGPVFISEKEYGGYIKRSSTPKTNLEDMPLDIKAEMALREAVAGAIAEHKLRGHPIIIWRDGKVVSIPPEEIVITSAKGDQPDRQRPEQLYVKEINQPYRKTKRRAKQ